MKALLLGRTELLAALFSVELYDLSTERSPLWMDPPPFFEGSCQECSVLKNGGGGGKLRNLLLLLTLKVSYFQKLTQRKRLQGLKETTDCGLALSFIGGEGK